MLPQSGQDAGPPTRIHRANTATNANMAMAEKAMSDRKCAPAIMRMPPTSVPNARAAQAAGSAIGAGARNAGATVQKAAAASPEANEQFRRHAPSNE